jgi:sulfur-oxidizing protein SoxZ
MVRVLINLPKKAHRGEVIEIKVLISHPMETGQRRNEMGQPIPRDIIHSFRCTYNNAVVLEADLFPAIAANPFLSFTAIAEDSGTLVFSFVDDHGAEQVEHAALIVE